jgi:glutamine amidotransferase
MEQLSKFGGALSEIRKAGTPILGICIGLQVLFEKSQESPGAKGLGWIHGEVVRLPEGVTIPQMGWNNISIRRPVDLLDGIADGDMFYFVHSYHCMPKDRSVIAATTDYGTEVTAMISNDNLTATQFHPEKSGQKGLRILENFARSTKC